MAFLAVGESGHDRANDVGGILVGCAPRPVAQVSVRTALRSEWRKPMCLEKVLAPQGMAIGLTGPNDCTYGMPDGRGSLTTLSGEATKRTSGGRKFDRLTLRERRAR